MFFFLSFSFLHFVNTISDLLLLPDVFPEDQNIKKIVQEKQGTQEQQSQNNNNNKKQQQQQQQKTNKKQDHLGNQVYVNFWTW